MLFSEGKLLEKGFVSVGAGVTRRLNVQGRRISTTMGLVSRKYAVPFVTQCQGRTAKTLDSRVLQGLCSHLICLQGLRSGGRAMLTSVRRRKGLARRLHTRVLTTRARITISSLCHPCHPGHHAHTAVTGRGNLRPLTGLVLLRGVAISPLRRTGGCIGPRGRITAPRRTLGKTGSVLTRNVSSGTSFHARVHRLAVGRNRLLSTTGSPSTRSICRVCCSFGRKLSGLTKRHVLTVGHKRGRGFLAMGVRTPASHVLSCLSQGVVAGPRTFATPILRRTLRSTCGQLVTPTVRHRVQGSLFRGTRSNTVHMFNGGLRRLLVRPPVTNRIMLN